MSGIDQVDYWASYQQTSQRGWYIVFNTGNVGRQYYTDKNYTNAVRATRKVAV